MHRHPSSSMLDEPRHPKTLRRSQASCFSFPPSHWRNGQAVGFATLLAFNVAKPTSAVTGNGCRAGKQPSNAPLSRNLPRHASDVSWATYFIFGTSSTALFDSSVLWRWVLDFVFYNSPLAQLLQLLVLRNLPVHLGIGHVLGQDVADKCLGD